MTSMPTPRIRLLLAEDHALVRDGLRMLLSVQADMELVADTDSGAAVIDLLCTHQPDVLLLDLGLPHLDGLGVLSALQQAALPTQVLVVSARQDAASVRQSLALGAAGYLVKNERSEDLLKAIRHVHGGGEFISPAVLHLLQSDGVATAASTGEPLTPRERDIAALVAQGLSSKVIAQRLDISDLTVRKHRENLCRKLGARNAAELVVMAVQLMRGHSTP